MGFNPELTARDNVLINAIMLGLTRKQARERFDEIIAFAELEEFVDLKLKNYSSGMSVRLGFSVAVQVDADVLLVDEVLAVGDASFQQKCFDEFDRMKRRGPDDPVRDPRHGARRALLRPRDAARARPGGRHRARPRRSPRSYSELNFGHAARRPSGRRRRARRVRIRGAWCEDADGERVVAARQGERCRACFEVEFDARRRRPGVHDHLPQRGAAHDLRRHAATVHGPTGQLRRRASA